MCSLKSEVGDGSSSSPSDALANSLYTSDTMLSSPTDPIQHLLTSISLPELPSSPIQYQLTWPYASFDDFSQPKQSRFGESSSTMLNELWYIYS